MSSGDEHSVDMEDLDQIVCWGPLGKPMWTPAFAQWCLEAKVVPPLIGSSSTLAFFSARDAIAFKLRWL